jgi:hypothetical protein
MAEPTLDDQRQVVRAVLNDLRPAAWRTLVGYFAPQLATHDPRLLQDLVFDEATRRHLEDGGRQPMEYLLDVLADLRLCLTVAASPDQPPGRPT